MDKLKRDVVENNEYRSLNNRYHSTREELIKMERTVDKLSDDKMVLEDEMDRKNSTLEYLRSKIPEITVLERLHTYEYNFINREFLGRTEKDTLYLPDPDGKELEIWDFMRAYAKECHTYDIEIDEEMSRIYASHHYGRTLKEAVKPKKQNYYTFQEYEYSL